MNESQEQVLDYIPKPQQSTSSPQPSAPIEYALVEDVAGNISDRYPIIKDGNGKEIRLPRPLNKNCKKCLGKGYLGMNTLTKKLIICHKCYPEAYNR